MSDLDARAIARERARLEAQGEGAAGGAPPVSVAERTGSTSDDARAAAARGAPHGAAFLADAQTAGRGRGAHVWHSPPGENLYLSVVLRPRVEARSVAPLTLAIGVAVAAALEPRLPPLPGGLRIKWPNDVLAGGRKLAGILVEGQLRGGQVLSLVAGVGVNVRARSFPPELAGRATSLALPPPDLDRSTLAAALLVEIGRTVARFEAGRLASFAGELARRDALCGTRVEVGELEGIAEGIDAEGRLLVRDDGGALHPVVSGEVLLHG